MKTQDEYKIWVENVKKLNDYINSLEIWNDYAMSCQREYDYLLTQNPRKRNQNG